MCVAACKPKTPSQYIQPDEIVDILVDYHIARAMGQIEGTPDEQNYNRALYWSAVMEKHNITQAQFDSSLTYYYSRSDRFNDIYREVYQRLEERSTLLGIHEGEIGKYSALQTTGDTANIWPGRKVQAMMPLPPYDYSYFTIDCDSTFREGDSFLIQFTSDFIYQSGSKNGILYVAIDYADTTLVRQTRFTFSGLIQLRLDGSQMEKGAPRRMKGYFYMGGADDRSTTLRLLFINNIQLIRFHKQYEKPKAETDSLSLDSLAAGTDSQTGSGGDSIGKGAASLPVGRRTSPNRMVERIDSLKKSN